MLNDVILFMLSPYDALIALGRESTASKITSMVQKNSSLICGHLLAFKYRKASEHIWTISALTE